MTAPFLCQVGSVQGERSVPVGARRPSSARQVTTLTVRVTTPRQTASSAHLGCTAGGVGTQCLMDRAAQAGTVPEGRTTPDLTATTVPWVSILLACQKVLIIPILSGLFTYVCLDCNSQCSSKFCSLPLLPYITKCSAIQHQILQSKVLHWESREVTYS